VKREVGVALVDGEAQGALAIWPAPLSFWGGYNALLGAVIDRTHPAFGQSAAGRIVAMPKGRGSSSSSAVLAEAIRLGTAPAAILLAEADPILVTGALVARRLYALTCPIAILPLAVSAAFGEGAMLSLRCRAREAIVVAI